MEYESLPQWAKDVSDVMASSHGYGQCVCDAFPRQPSDVSTMTVHTNEQPKLFNALLEARRIGLAHKAQK